MCSRCGAVLRASGASHSPTLDILSERRPVTALFCDLVDSVALTMRLDAEEMLDVLGAYHAACDETVPKFGGYITQYMGDGILAYFGYPSAGEDDAANAVSAAIALRDRIKRLDLPSGISLHSRIGVATGVVAINIPRGQAEGRKANLAGMAPNVAARLQSIAPPDGIIIDSTTRRITGGRFTCRDGGRVALKGFQDSVEVFEVIGAATGVSRFQARSPDGTAPLAGREAEFNLLLAGWSRVQAGTGEVIVVQGEPGIGKSRIVDALRQHLAVGQILQMSWYCAPDRSDSALHPVIEHLSHRAGISPGDSPVRRGEKLDAVMDRSAVTDARGRAELKALLGVPPDPLPAEPMTSERRREVLLQTLLGMVDRLAGTGPALLVLEDLHWADSTTLELLDRSRRLAADRPWLMVCTCRQDFDVRKNLGDGASQIQLNRLAHGNADRIVAYFDHEQRLSAEAKRQIVARSDGIPLFVEEMTKAVLEALADAPTTALHLDDVIPQTLQASLTARLDRLGPARRIATVAAAIGRRFTYELLSAVVAHPPAEVDADLHALVRSGLVEPLGDAPATAYLFKHALIREAAYESLLKREREDLHGRIAAALRTRFTGMHAAEPELLAYHLTRSGALEEAVSLWQAAGERAAAAGAHVEAAAHLTTALDLLRRSASVESRTRTELRLLRGLVVSLAMTRGYSAPEAGKAAAEARAICDRLDDPEEQCGILINYCGFSVVAGDIAATEDMAGRCMRMAEQTGHIRHRISSACAFGLAKFVRGEFAAAEHHLGVAIELYNRNDGRHLPRVTAQDSLTVCYSAVPLIRWATAPERTAPPKHCWRTPGLLAKVLT